MKTKTAWRILRFVDRHLDSNVHRCFTLCNDNTKVGTTIVTSTNSKKFAAALCKTLKEGYKI